MEVEHFRRQRKAKEIEELAIPKAYRKEKKVEGC